MISLAAGWMLTWALGVGLVAALPRRSAGGDGELAWAIGSGWFVGALLVTLWMRALSAAGVPFGTIAIGAPLAAVAVVAFGIAAWRRRRMTAATVARAWRGLVAADLAGWQRVAWFALLAWLALRYSLLLGEVLWRPLHPWDAWTQWATKARVWYELGSMVPFVATTEWTASQGAVYYDAAPHYPATIPLWQVWSCVLLGRWDDAAMNLPWWGTGLALALALFGFLRRAGFALLPSLAATWLVASMPFLDVHVALAGYADLPMAAYLTLAVLAGLRWLQSRSPHDLAPAVLFACALPLVKNPGKAWLALLLPALVVAFLPRQGPRLVAIAFAAAVAALVVLAQTDPVVLGYRLHLTYDFPWRGLVDAYFRYANWHLLWYAALAAAILGRRAIFAPELAPLTVFVGAGLMFLLFGFAFTNARIWVEDQSTVNRATLHVAPLVFVWVILVFRAWARGSSGAVAATAPGRA